MVRSDRTRGDRHKLKHRRFSLNIRKHIFTVKVTALAQVAQAGCGDSQTPAGPNPGQLALGDPASAEDLDQRTLALL